MYGNIFDVRTAGFLRGHAMKSDALRFPALQEVRGYWEALRNGNEPPKRADVDPRGLAGALEQAFMLERVAPGVARFRIAGMKLSDVMGMDVRGMPLLSLIDPPARAEFALALEQVFAGPAMLEMALEAERGIGRPALEARLLILPLRDHYGATKLAMGCLATEGAIGRCPRRFAVARKIVTPVRATSQIVETLPEPMMGMAEAPAPFVIPARPAPGQPFLRLVKTDRT